MVRGLSRAGRLPGGLAGPTDVDARADADLLADADLRGYRPLADAVSDGYALAGAVALRRIVPSAWGLSSIIRSLAITKKRSQRLGSLKRNIPKPTS